MQFTDQQLAFLMRVADAVPQLVKAIGEGNCTAEWYLGKQTLPNGTHVELKLVAQDSKSGGRGDNPYPASPHKNTKES